MPKNILSKTYPDLGLLIIRVGIGATMFQYGWPKITGGTDIWKDIGSSMSVIGITFFPVFWGLCAAIAEAVGGLLMAAGIFFRPVILLLWFTMLIAVLVNMQESTSFNNWAHAAELGIVFLGLLFTGAGKYVLKFG
ncbi:MAG: DoxX family protein [Chitinophagaceae bacterium]|nr:DoxX family protein [Chitinophagaceae bacterium]